MRDPTHLPDSLSIIVAAFALLLPFALTFAGRRMAGLRGIIPVDEPSGKTTSPSRPGAPLSLTCYGRRPLHPVAPAPPPHAAAAAPHLLGDPGSPTPAAVH